LRSEVLGFAFAFAQGTNPIAKYVLVLTRSLPNAPFSLVTTRRFGALESGPQIAFSDRHDDQIDGPRLCAGYYRFVICCWQ
jgi:hypothetical protein